MVMLPIRSPQDSGYYSYRTEMMFGLELSWRGAGLSVQ